MRVRSDTMVKIWPGHPGRSLEKLNRPSGSLPRLGRQLPPAVGHSNFLCADGQTEALVGLLSHFCYMHTANSEQALAHTHQHTQHAARPPAAPNSDVCHRKGTRYQVLRRTELKGGGERSKHTQNGELAAYAV